MAYQPTLRQLRYLAALAELRHFGRAAEACLVTQPTLSAALQELEAGLGVRLVERSQRKVLVTPLGERVVARARAVLAQVDELVELAAGAAEPLSGVLRMGVIPTIGPFLLPLVLPTLRERHLALRLHLREDLSARLIEGLHLGTLDVLLLALPYEAEGVVTLGLGRDPFFVVCPPDHALAGEKAVSTARLVDETLLLLEDGHCLRDHALAACKLSKPKGGAAASEVRGTSLHTLVQMAANGLGITLLPKMALEAGLLRGTGLVARPLADGENADGENAREIGLMWRATSARGDEFRLLARALAITNS